jgi:hypothetical protein
MHPAAVHVVNRGAGCLKLSAPPAIMAAASALSLSTRAASVASHFSMQLFHSGTTRVYAHAR